LPQAAQPDLKRAKLVSRFPAASLHFSPESWSARLNGPPRIGGSRVDVQPYERLMASKEANLNLTCKEISALFAQAQWAERFPPFLTVDQVAVLLSVPKATVYDWSSRGLLDGCCAKVGKHLRFVRDRLIQRIFNEGLNQNA
jgi:excisionase family DNA binding protein